MSLAKSIKSHHLIALAGVVVIVYALYRYSGRKFSISDAFDNQQKKNMKGGSGSASGMNGPSSGVAQPANPAGQNEEYAKVTGLTTSTYGLAPSCNGGKTSSPGDLLPRDDNSSQFAKLNPLGNADFNNVSLLKAGYHLGINTVGSSLRNANLQLRSEPPNPTAQVSPWLQSTIEPDLMRAPLEIGCGPQ